MKVAQITPEDYLFELNFFQDHDSVFSFPVSSKVMETFFFSGVATIFTKDLRLVQISAENVCLNPNVPSMTNLSVFLPVSPQITEK